MPDYGPFRQTNGQFGPNNPGRPVGTAFSKRIREVTGDGKDLVDFAMRVMQGKELETHIDGEGGRHELPPPVNVRLSACKWLAERGFGKMPLVTADEGALEGASDADLLSQVIDAMDPAVVARVVAGKKLPKTAEAH